LFYKTGTHSLPSTQPDFQRTGNAGRTQAAFFKRARSLAPCRQLVENFFEARCSFGGAFQGRPNERARTIRVAACFVNFFSAEPLAADRRWAFRCAGRPYRRFRGLDATPFLARRDWLAPATRTNGSGVAAHPTSGVTRSRRVCPLISPRIRARARSRDSVRVAG